MPSFKITGILVLEKKILKVFTIIILSWRPSWSCDLDHSYKLLFPLALNLALIGLAVSEEKMFEHCGRTDDDNYNNGRRSMGIL